MRTTRQTHTKWNLIKHFIARYVEEQDIMVVINVEDVAVLGLNMQSRVKQGLLQILVFAEVHITMAHVSQVAVVRYTSTSLDKKHV